MDKVQEALSFKSFLYQDENPTEIRRFALNGGQLIQFQTLVEKLNQLYEKNLQAGGYTIFWKDEDCDEILMSSNEELSVAIQSQKTSDVIKLHIRKLKKSTSEPKEDADVHKRVICDGCENEVRGFRYKCVQCPDFDLCGGCENKKQHAEHMMIRIPSPIHDYASFGFPFFRRGGGRPRHCHMRGHPFRHHFKHQGEHGKPCSQKCEGGNGDFTIPDLVDPFIKLLGRFGKPEAASNQSEGAASAHPNSSEPKPEEYLQSIGETVAALLDPLGIDVSVDVEHKGETTHCNVPNKEKESGADGKKDTGAGNGAEQTTESTPAETPTKNESFARMEETLLATAKHLIPTLTETLANFTQQSQSQHEQSPNPMDTTDWTYVDGKDLEGDGLNMPSEPAPSVNSTLKDGQTTSASEQVPESGSKVEAGLNSMLAMGYDNENGWLTKLLKLNDGHVGRTLDTISLFHQKTDQSAALVVSLLEECNGNIPELLQILQAMKKYY